MVNEGRRGLEMRFTVDLVWREELGVDNSAMDELIDTVVITTGEAGIVVVMEGLGEMACKVVGEAKGG